MLPSRVVTSARRYRSRGIYRQALLNQMIKVMYRLHLDPQWINRLYEQTVQINVTYSNTLSQSGASDAND